MKDLLTFYRNHLCVVIEEFGDGEYDLEAIAEVMSTGNLGRCDCAKYQFIGVRPTEFFALHEALPSEYGFKLAGDIVAKPSGYEPVEEEE